MTNNTLTVYGNQGKVKYPSNINEENISIRSAWSAKRRFIAKNDDDGNLIQCFARMHTGRHEEQLYLEFRYQNARNVFEEFSQAINNQLINGQGWKLLDHKTNRYINTIMSFGRSDSSNLPLSEIEMLVDDGQDVTTFTSDPTKAILLAHEILTRGYDVTIANKKDSLKYCDVGVHVATKYTREITLSEDNKEYYREQKKQIKRTQLRKPLEEAVQNVKSELGQDTFVSMLEDVISDTEYRLSLRNSESESESTDHSTKKGETTKYGGYSPISYGLNVIAGIIVLLYIASKALEYTGTSLSEQIGTSFEITAVFVSVFLLGYGSLGALWAMSDVSEKDIGGLGLLSAVLSGIISYLVEIGPLRDSFPAVIGGFSWWITLSVVPALIAAVVLLAIIDYEVLEPETESTDSLDINSSFAVLAGFGILGGFMLGNYGLLLASTYLFGGSIGIVAFVVILFAVVIGVVAYYWQLGKYQTRISKVGITLVTFSIGLGISGSLVRYNIAPQLQQPLFKIPIAVVIGLLTYRITDYTTNRSSVFDGEDEISILTPVSEDGDTPIVQGPKFTVEVSNELDADWVTLTLIQNNNTVDTEELPFEAENSQDKLSSTLEAVETGRHTIKAHTGKGSFSGQEGGIDELDITVSSIEESSSPNSDNHLEEPGLQDQSPATNPNSGATFDGQSQGSDSDSWEFDSNIEETEPTQGTDDHHREPDHAESESESSDNSESDDGWSGY